MIKKVALCVYAHRSNTDELFQYLKKNTVETPAISNFIEAIKRSGVPFDVVKYDRQRKTITVITSPDWDPANEPIVGECRRWDKSTWTTWSEHKTIPAPTVTVNNKQIYHNKWMFVANNYTGFDIEEAKKRTEQWNAIPNIKSFKSKIGYKSFWIQLLQKNGLDV